MSLNYSKIERYVCVKL